MTHRSFKLSKASRSDIQEDGSKHHFVELDSFVMTVIAGAVDLIVHDKDENVILDKKKRLDNQSKFAALVYKHRACDATLDHMLKSYQLSVSDPKNELVHLYEIRDALSKNFSSENAAIAQLGITRDEWNDMGRMANSLTIQQGRHRGEAIRFLRSAEPVKLDETRKLAARWVENILIF